MDMDNIRDSLSSDDMDEMNQEEIIYLGDADEVLEAFEDEIDSAEDEEFVPSRDDAIKTFTPEEPDKSVFCIAVHPEDKIWATGTEADKLYIWNANGILQCSFDFEDSVVVVQFSADGTLLAAADMAGNIKVYNVTKEPYTSVFEYAVGDIQFLIWHKQANVLFAGSITGDIYVLKVPSGDCKILLGHGSKVNCASLMADGTRIAAGYDDGVVKIWDIKNTSVQKQINTDSQIITIDTHFENNVIMIGTAEGKMTLINATNGKILNDMKTNQSVESVAFYNNAELNLSAIGCLDGSIVIWDVTRNAIRQTLESQAGVVTIKWLTGAKIISAHLDGCIRIYDGRSGVLENLFMGHRRAILDLAVSKNHKTFATASDDGTAKLFDLQNPPPVEMDS